jgi:glycosyltransferase involved in cell wall biosynthesis
MKILLVHNFYGSSAPSGENTVFEAERELLKSHGHTVIEFTRHSDEIRARGLTGKIIGALSTPWNSFSLRKLRTLIKNEKPDIMHVHNFFPLISPSVFHAAKATGTATVFTLHNYRIFCAAGIPMRDGAVCTECIDKCSAWPALKYGCYRESRIATIPLAVMIALHRRLGTWRKHADAFITLTEFQRRTVVRAGLPESRTHVKPHFYADPPAAIPFLKRDGEAVFIGRISREKGVDVLINAWHRMGCEAPHLEIIGDGPEKVRLSRAVRDAGLENWIAFSGQLSFSDTQKRLANARALILPTLCFEGFPMVIREAFALGVPVIASRIGSIPDIVSDGQNGMLFEPGNDRELCRCVDAIDTFQPLAAAAYEEFKRKYTAGSNIQTLMDIYQSAIKQRRDSL